MVTVLILFMVARATANRAPAHQRSSRFMENRPFSSIPDGQLTSMTTSQIDAFSTVNGNGSAVPPDTVEQAAGDAARNDGQQQFHTRPGAATVARARQLLQRMVAGYSPEEPKPLGGYAELAGVFHVLLGAGIVAAARRDPDSLDAPRAADLALIAVATHKLSRLVTKDKVTSFLRAPFTEYHEDATTHGEVEEVPRGFGLQRSIGELLTCPYCMGQWIVGAFAVGYALDRRRTRWFASLYAAMTLADFLHLAYLRATKDAAKS